ncbi:MULTISPECIES: DUF1497 domain-containing protein [unclassified Lactococcus]|uniref:DUF1497 domain-containing protein n=1 Tax=unclassified Lactococcus TaxID=2643510 RepID=UPI0011C871C6|nr:MULTISPECIES: DUF1497 domain-containing protein [unclassified Lactococcus]MQW21983.1 DUF1497 domain-containing protein [Lactococcus sp. dk101]TXK36836.1 DUF1497 domain-containing protein [Lactococcus sp. dk310]TXK47466.1 DUF1497 domain-containing protein [Lactococcus sp. dk322]
MAYYDRRNEARRISILASSNAPKEIKMKELEKASESQFNREFQADFHKRITELGAKK